MTNTIKKYPALGVSLLPILGLTLVLSACDRSSSSGSAPIENVPDTGAASAGLEQGVLLDSVVTGARYDAGDGVTGVTDEFGIFNYRPGHPVTFYLGELKLGTALPIDKPAHLTDLQADKVVTPLELAGDQALLDDPATLNIARLLIAVDADGDPSNGIEVPAAVVDRSEGAGTVSYDNDASVVEAIRYLNNDVDETGPIPNREETVQHLCESIRTAGCETDPQEPVASTTDGVTTDGSATDGSTTNGSATDGTTTDGSATDGSVTNGSTTDGVTTDGTSTAGTTPDPVATPNQAPYIEGVPQGTAIAGESYLFTPEAVDPDGDSIVFEISGKPDWATFDTSNGIFAGSPQDTDVGTTGDIVISVSDGSATSQLDVFSIDVTQTNTAPVISGDPRPAISSGSEYRFIPTVINTDGDALEFSVQAKPSWVQFDTATGEIFGFPDKNDVGFHDAIIITVSDGQLFSSIGPFSIDVNLANTAPVITGTPLTTVAGGNEYTFSPDTTDVDSDPLVFSISNTPAWADFNATTGKLSGAPANDDTGNYADIVISVSDGRETAQLTPFSIDVTYTNTAPVISGTPATSLLPDESYSFTPVTVDDDPDTTLIYTAQNLPVWASLDAATGTISGVPAAEGLHEGIVLSVSDGSATDKITFFLRVQDVQDFAQPYGIASEGSRLSGFSAQGALDGNTSTFNHTDCETDVNWWQVAMPIEIDIHRIEITSRSSLAERINGATVIVSGNDYDDLTGAEPVRATLADTTAPQVFEFDPPLKGSRVAVKAAGANCLHMSDVKVFGRGPDAPLLSSQEHLRLPAPATIGDWVGKIEAQDLQGDPINYTLTGDSVPYEIDSLGNITVSGAIDHNTAQQFAFTVTASDSVNESVSNVIVSLLGQPGVQLERWDDIPGTQVSELTDNNRYLLAPDHSEVISELDKPDGPNVNYGMRLTAYLRPLVSGDYYFSISADDAAVLEISPSADSSQTEQVAQQTSFTSYQNWSTSSESNVIRLNAGSAYFVRVLYKEGVGGDHVSVGWRTADQSAHSLIPANQLFVGAATPETVKPYFRMHDTDYLVGQATTPGSLVAVIGADDTHNDSLTYSIVEDVPFSIDQNGAVTVSGALAPGTTYSLTVSSTDGTHTTNTAITVETTVLDEVEHALATGDAYVVSQVNLIEEEILATIENGRTLHNDALIQIYNLDPTGLPKADGSSLTEISWNPTWRSSLLRGSYGDNITLLTTNSTFTDGYTVKNWPLAILGESSGRYIAMGNNPMSNYRKDNGLINEQMHQFLENSLAWLTDRSDLETQPFNVVLGNLAQTHDYPGELAVREWLDERFSGMASYNERKTCDDSALASCITPTTELLIVSQQTDAAGNEQAVADAVASAMDQGVPVLYLHYSTGITPLGSRILALLDAAYSTTNWLNRLSLDSSDQSSYMNQLPDSIMSLKTMMQNFRDQDFVVDWVPCSKDWCTPTESVVAQFSNGANFVRTALRGFDSNKQNIFAEPDTKRLYKLLALLGDYYRRDAVFPMDTNDTPALEFFRARYADYSQYQYRDRVGVWTDLGNFSRTDFSHISPTTRTVNHTSKIPFLSTGAYALPGVPVTVKRNDNSDVGVTVFVNTVKDSATQLYRSYGYKRPRYLSSASMTIAPGETISFVSSVGGPVHLGYSTNDVAVEVEIANIGEHAYWRSTADNESFTAKLDADEFDWAEVATPSFEVHSKIDKMRNSVNDPVLLEGAGVTQALVDAILRYVHNFPHVLAGYQGPGIDQVPEIHDFATNNGFTVQNLDIVKHMNADQNSCGGGGCSGNPYDAEWSFNPVSYGDIHEIGHGLERDRFLFAGFPGHTRTDLYGFYTKSHYYTTTGGEPNCRTLPFEAVYAILKDSFSAADSKAYIKENLWDDSIQTVEGTLHNIQMMMAAQDNGALENGWHLWARLHMIEREYQAAVNNDDKWAENKDGLGMGLYERTAAKSMSNEDWMLITVSHSTGFDYREFFDVWGHTYTAEASAQVAAMSFPSMPLNYYVSSPTGYCKGEGFDGARIPLDGSATWPLSSNEAPANFSSLPMRSLLADPRNQHHLETAGPDLGDPEEGS